MLNVRLRRHEDGFTLPELLVITVLLGLVGTVVMATVISGSRSVRIGEARIDALNDLQKGMDRIGRELRAADPIVLDPNGNYAEALSAEISRDGTDYRYTYYLVTLPTGETELRQDIETLDADGNVVDTRSGLFITEIANPTMSPPLPLFTYYDGEGTVISCTDLDLTDAGDQATCRDRHLTAAQLRFAIAKTLPEQDPIQLQTVVNVRNTRYTG